LLENFASLMPPSIPINHSESFAVRDKGRTNSKRREKNFIKNA
jgi:hypothetical protein